MGNHSAHCSRRAGVYFVQQHDFSSGVFLRLRRPSQRHEDRVGRKHRVGNHNPHHSRRPRGYRSFRTSRWRSNRQGIAFKSRIVSLLPNGYHKYMIHCPSCLTPIEAVPSSKLPLRERIQMQLRAEPPPEGIKGDCLIWTGAASGKPDPYGTIMVAGVHTKAHRLWYELEVGPIGEGLQLDHLCRRTLCCNPDHLEPVTGKVNILRSTGPAAINAAKTRCKNGHEFTPENTILRKGGGRKCRTCHYEEIIRRRRKAGVLPWESGKPGCPPTWTPSAKIC